MLWPEEVEARIRAEAYNADEQETPDAAQMCTRCVMTSQRPRIVFDEHGVCSACRYAEAKRTTIDWDKRAEELDWLLHRHRKDSGYDVIVPCSGGKDSSMVAHRLKHEHGMTPLCVKWAPFLYTDIGRRNLDAFVQSGFDALICHPNGLIHRKLARLSLEYYGDPFQPFVYGQLAWPMHAAQRFGVPLVMFGENGEAEYGGDPGANDKPCWGRSDWDRIYTKGASVGRLVDMGVELGALDAGDVRALSPFYAPPQPVEAEFHWFGYYRRWWPQENFYHASEHTGFRVNDERSQGTYSKYASLDDKLDGLHYWFSWLKFGIGRATSDAAHEVRDGDITRDEALQLVRRFDGEFPARYFNEVLEYLGLDEGHFATIVERFNASGVDHRARMEAA